MLIESFHMDASLFVECAMQLPDITAPTATHVASLVVCGLGLCATPYPPKFKKRGTEVQLIPLFE
jgi:hypothetical protein